MSARTEAVDAEPKPQFSLLRIVILLGFAGILFGLVFPVLSLRHPGPARMAKARIEISVLVQAIRQYEVAYGHLPTPMQLRSDSVPDFTFGTLGMQTRTAIINGKGSDANNAELVAILCDQTHFGNGKTTENRDHALNPQRHRFLIPPFVRNTASPGVGMDGVYRDPWGNPYIITLDLNHDGRCRDAFYRLASVSGLGAGTNGLFGLTRFSSATSPDAFEAQVPVMVWSLGPDGKAHPSRRADEGVNKDTILSWLD